MRKKGGGFIWRCLLAALMACSLSLLTGCHGRKAEAEAFAIP